MYNWKKESARDLIALGSWIFFVLVIGRALIKPYRPFVDEMVIAGILIFLISLFYKEIDFYVVRSFVIMLFTSLFYNNSTFSFFAILAFVGVCFSRYYLKEDFIEIFKGLIVGIIVSLGGYYLPLIYFS
jgi:hypothetical protein